MNALYDQFITFSQELSKMYPNDPDFSLFVTTLRLLRTTNPSILVKYIVERAEHESLSITSLTTSGPSLEEAFVHLTECV
jgi:hypothetical protein